MRGSHRRAGSKTHAQQTRYLDMPCLQDIVTNAQHRALIQSAIQRTHWHQQEGRARLDASNNLASVAPRFVPHTKFLVGEPAEWSMACARP